MIRIFYGTPGAGKSYDSLRDLVDELLYGTRLIVTNLSIDTGRLNAHLSAAHPGIDYGDINHRLRIITEEETRHFYSYRSVAGAPLRVPDREKSLSGVHVDYTDAQAVAYYIDEAHIAFDAREWATTGPELTYYASQHRKLNDECIFITQHPDMLESRLRKLAQEFWSHNNNGIERFWTYFTKPSYFSVEVHRKPPSGPNAPEPMATYRFRLDKKLADCYDTSAGIGIKGRKMPEKKRKPGLSLFWLLVPLALLAYFLFKAPDLATAGFDSVLEPALKDTAEKNSVLSPPSPNGRDSGEVGTSSNVVSLPVSVRSYAVTASDLLVTLTDGRTLSKADGIVRLTKDAVYLSDGSSYRINRGSPPPRPSVAGAAQPPGN